MTEISAVEITTRYQQKRKEKSNFEDLKILVDVALKRDGANAGSGCAPSSHQYSRRKDTVCLFAAFSINPEGRASKSAGCHGRSDRKCRQHRPWCWYCRGSGGPASGAQSSFQDCISQQACHFSCLSSDQSFISQFSFSRVSIWGFGAHSGLYQVYHRHKN